MKVKKGMASSVSLFDPVDALRQGLEKVRVKLAELNADDGEEQADGAERKCRRIAEQQHDDERREHDGRQIGDNKRGHDFPLNRRQRLLLFDRFDEMLDLGLQCGHLRLVWVRDHAAHDRDSLDQL